MAESTTAPTNKYVAFKDRAQKEYGKRGLISETALRKTKKKSAFAKKASHNPPKPDFAVSEVTDRYGNTYTLDPGYQAGPTSPLPPYRPPPRAERAADVDRPRAKRKPARDRDVGEPPARARDVPLPRPRPEPTFATRPTTTPAEPTFATRPPPVSRPFGTVGGVAGQWTGYPSAAPADTAYAAPSGAAPAPLPATYPSMGAVPLPQPRPELAPSSQPTFATQPPQGANLSDLLGIFRAILPSMYGNPRGYYGG